MRRPTVKALALALALAQALATGDAPAQPPAPPTPATPGIEAPDAPLPREGETPAADRPAPASPAVGAPPSPAVGVPPTGPPPAGAATPPRRRRRRRPQLEIPVVPQENGPGATATLELRLPPGAELTVDGEPTDQTERLQFDEFLYPPGVRRVELAVRYADGTTDQRMVEARPGARTTVNLYKPPAGEPLTTVTQAISPLEAVSLSADGRWLVTGAEDASVVLWDTRLGRPVRTFDGHTGAVFSVALSAEGRLLVTGSADHTAALWDVASGRRLATFHGHDQPVTAVALHPSGDRVLTASVDATAKLWDVATRGVLHTIDAHEEEVASVNFSPDGARFVTTGLDSKAMLWETGSGRLLHDLTGHRDRVYSGVFSLDGRFVCTGSADNTAILWDIETGKPVAQTGRHPVDIVAVVLNPDASRIFTAPRDFTVGEWDRYRRGELVRSLTSHILDVTAMATSSDGRLLLTAARDRCVRVWDIDTGQELACLAADRSLTNWAVASPEGLFDASADGRQLIGYGFAEGLPGAVIEDFSEERFRPGLLGQLFAGERPGSPRQMGRSAPPGVRIVSPTSGAFDSAEATVEIELTDHGGGAERVRLFSNGALVSPDHVEPVDGAEGLYRATVALAPGMNRLVAKAMTADRSWDESSATLELERLAPPSRPARLYVVRVRQAGAAPSADDPSERLAEVLKDRNEWLYPRVDRVEVAIDSGDAWIEQVAEIAELTGPQDALLVLAELRGATESRLTSVVEALGEATSHAGSVRRALVLDCAATPSPPPAIRLTEALEQTAHRYGAHCLVSVRTSPGDGGGGAFYPLTAALAPTPGPLADTHLTADRPLQTLDVTDWFGFAVRHAPAEGGGVVLRSSQSSGFPIAELTPEAY